MDPGYTSSSFKEWTGAKFTSYQLRTKFSSAQKKLFFSISSIPNERNSKTGKEKGKLLEVKSRPPKFNLRISFRIPFTAFCGLSFPSQSFFWELVRISPHYNSPDQYEPLSSIQLKISPKIATHPIEIFALIRNGRGSPSGKRENFRD